jgi:peptidoglycan-N-acetylglucosamine deacetylase
VDESCYIVQSADLAEGLLGIARRLYGDESRWLALYEANRFVIGDNPTVLRSGQQLALAAPLAARWLGGAGPTYHVQVQDIIGGLEGLAQRLWGQPARWVEIYALNRAVIGDDPQALQPGQCLILP